jgi:phasin family protein
MTQTVELITTTAQQSMSALQEVASKAQADTKSLVELNLATAKNLMTESFEYANAMVTAKDPQSLVAIQAGLVKPVTEIANAYAQELGKIMASAGNEFMMAAKNSMADVQKGITSMMGSATSNAPAGAGFAVDSFSQVMAVSQKIFEAAQTSTDQAIKIAKKTSKTA